MQDNIPPQLFYAILKALDIDIGEFVYRVLNESPKEVMIYAKIYALYNSARKDKTLLQKTNNET